MSERSDCDRLADKLLDEPNADPDDDLRMLSRQLLRRREVIERLEKRLVEMSDNTLDLVHANRDSMLRIAEEALRRISVVVKKARDGTTGVCDYQFIYRILEAANTFHPMHGESWKGWPE